jgi:hypothetical protein
VHRMDEYAASVYTAGFRWDLSGGYMVLKWAVSDDSAPILVVPKQGYAFAVSGGCDDHERRSDQRLVRPILAR